MNKYYLTDGTNEEGPLDLDALRTKNISPATPVRLEGQEGWTTAGQIEELQSLFAAATPSFTPGPPAPAEEVKTSINETVVPASETVTTSTTAAAVAATPKETIISTAAPIAAKKSTLWLSWVLSLLVLGAAGYFVYQDMEKNKTAGTGTVNTAVADSTGYSNASATEPVTTQNPPLNDTAGAADPDTAGTVGTTTVTTAVEPTTTATVPATTPANQLTAEQVAAKKAAAKKLEDEKKKQLALKKAADDKKKLEAALAAAAARELEMRKNWPRYISVGNLNYETKGDGIKAFDVPVYNGTDVMVDQVTLRIEYSKKNEKKIVKTESITVYNIPPKAGINGKAPESKKGEKVNVFITSITARKLHFCYPQNNGNPADPYYCN